MHSKILLNFFLIFIFLSSGCEDFYNFEANKLNKKAQTLIEKSKIESDTDKKVDLLIEALLKIEKIQKRYKKTKIARAHRKENKIADLSTKIDNLRILSSKLKLENEITRNKENIDKYLDLAKSEFRNGNKSKSSLSLLNAAELSIKQIGDSRTKARLSTQISQLRLALNDKDNAFKNLIDSEKYISEMYTDLPKKIKNMAKVYEILGNLKKKDKQKEIEERIYLIIDNEIKNNDNKASAYVEIAKTNLLINNIEKVKRDLKKSSKLAEKSATYVDIARIFYEIKDIEQCKLHINKAKTAANSKDQIFWVVRELINISLFEKLIGLEKESHQTLLIAINNLPSRPDERLVLELVDAFARIDKIVEAEELIKLIKTRYEKSMAFAFIGKQLAKKNKVKDMENYLGKAIEIAPNLIVGNYEFQGLPGFSTKGRIFAEVSKSFALVGNFDKSHELVGLIESDRFYKEGISEVILIQAKKDKVGASKLALKMINLGGAIVDNKFIGKIAYAQSMSGDIENSLITIKKMSVGFDLSETLINIANEISLQQANPLT